MPRFLNIAVNLAGRRCLVVGAGQVAARKARLLLEYGARITLIAPQATEVLRRAAERSQLVWRRAPYRSGDIDGNALVIAATDDRGLNRAIREEAGSKGIPCCDTSDAAETLVLFPAVYDEGGATFAVHTHGQDPRRAAELRDELAAALAGLSEQARNLSVAPPSPGGRKIGKVYIVGAGPGASDLITIRALRAIESADVVIYDRILGQRFLESLDLSPRHRDVQWLGAGCKGPERQAEIEARMLRAAQAGQTVARVKNGDPFIFGRGAEEIRFLCAHGIPWEVVPGLSSATSVLTASGFPLTSRQVGRSFAVTSAKLAGGELNRDYPRADSLVVLMAAGALTEVTDLLMHQGWPADTPAAVIEHGQMSTQRIITAPIAKIADHAAQASVRSPAILALGAVAAEALSPIPIPDESAH